jgi:fructose-bisphosphate aldolase, class I
MKLSQSAERIAGKGFIAALDQSGGSTPDALAAYGIEKGSWKDDNEMYELVHEMRKRIITDPAFDQRVSGAILFEQTMLSDIDGMPTGRYLLEKKNVVPFLKVDEGPEKQITDDVQLMKPMAGLDERLQSAVDHQIYGTKMRSVIHGPNRKGIKAIVKQQFEVAQKIIQTGLMPIIEPEVNIQATEKSHAEEMLRNELLPYLDALPDDQKVILKLTLPDEAGFYQWFIEHPNVLRVVALSGGYPRPKANKMLSENKGMTASFSRALVEDLRKQQTDEEFSDALDKAIQSIYDASIS